MLEYPREVSVGEVRGRLHRVPHRDLIGRAVDYWPFGIIALLAIVFGGVSIFVVPLVGLIGIGMLGYYAWRGFVNRNEDPDNDPGR